MSTEEYLYFPIQEPFKELIDLIEDTSNSSQRGMLVRDWWEKKGKKIKPLGIMKVNTAHLSQHDIHQLKTQFQEALQKGGAMMIAQNGESTIEVIDRLDRGITREQLEQALNKVGWHINRSDNGLNDWLYQVFKGQKTKLTAFRLVVDNDKEWIQIPNHVLFKETVGFFNIALADCWLEYPDDINQDMVGKDEAVYLHFGPNSCIGFVKSKE